MTDLFCGCLSCYPVYDSWRTGFNWHDIILEVVQGREMLTEQRLRSWEVPAEGAKCLFMSLNEGDVRGETDFAQIEASLLCALLCGHCFYFKMRWKCFNTLIHGMQSWRLKTEVILNFLSKIMFYCLTAPNWAQIFSMTFSAACIDFCVVELKPKQRCQTSRWKALSTTDMPCLSQKLAFLLKAWPREIIFSKISTLNELYRVISTLLFYI